MQTRPLRRFARERTRLLRRSLLGVLAVVLVGLYLGLPSVQPVAARSGLQFIERTTRGAAQNAKDSALPMLVVLHGLGDSPENFVGLFEELAVPARIIAVRAPDPWGQGTSWYPIDADAQRKSRQILARADAVASLIAELRAARPTRGKPVVSGFSQGGVLSFAMASYHAAELQAAVPIAGSLPEGLPAPKKPPQGFSVLAFHGEKDARIPVRDGERTFERLKQAGYKGSIITFPGLGHGVNAAMHAHLTAALNELLDLASASKSP
ncbi:MAG: alpha/beta fold hydrolase [Myxococcales bacterium]